MNFLPVWLLRAFVSIRTNISRVIMRANTIAPPSIGAGRGEMILTGLLALLVLQAVALQQVAGSRDDAKIFDNYRPLAMDESLSIRKDGVDYPIGGNSPYGLSNEAQIINVGQKDKGRSPGKYVSKKPHNIGGPVAKESEIREFDDVIENKPTNFKPLPDRPDSELTKLIANKGHNPPTFTVSKVYEPSITDVNLVGKQGFGSSRSDGDEILASYNLMIPIFVPGINPKRRAARQRTKRPEVKFVTETKTDMMPVKRTGVGRVKEVIKAEKVPQELVTDYVSVKGNGLPKRISDAVLPGEQVVKTTVQVID